MTTTEEARTPGQEPGRAAFARWSSLQPEFQDRIWASMSDDVRAFWVRQENDQAVATAAGGTPWKTGQSSYAREAVVLDAEDQALEVAVTTTGRIDLIIHNKADDGFDDLTARMPPDDAGRVAAALVEAGALTSPSVLWSAWPEDDCDSDPRIDPMAQKVTEWFVGRWPVGSDEPECSILIGSGRSAEIVARRIAEKLTSILNTDAILARRATPTPSSPGVPDSVREAVAELEKATFAYAKASEQGAQPYSHARINVALARAREKALDWALSLLAEPTANPESWVEAMRRNEAGTPCISTHPAGQSTGQGAEDRSNASGARTKIGAALDASMEARGGNRQQAFFREAAARVPAPDSTRTGPVETVAVPVEPTPEMLKAYWQQTGESHEMRTRTEASGKARYVAMIAARPAAPEAQGAWSFDMEAAPREHGRELLGWGRLRGSAPMRAIMTWFDAGGDFNGKPGWWTVASLPFEPIAFQPLPAPPSSGQGGR